MTVTHDFTLLASWDTADGWSGSNDVQVVAVSEPKLEGSGAVSIVKSGTTEQWFYAEYQLPNPADASGGKLLVFYLYLRPTVLSKLDAFRIRVYDSNGRYTDLNYDHKLAGGGWKPVIINSNITTGIDWSKVAKIRFTFHTPSPSNTFQEGDIVLDRLLVGSGFYVLYSSETTPDTIEELARLDAEDGLMLIEALNRNMYIVKARIYVGNGTDTGALKISQALVVFDGTDMMQWWDVHIWVMAGSSLVVENSVLVLGERPAYPHGAGVFRMYETSHVVLRRVYVITDAPLLFGASHFSFWTGRLETEDVLTNFQFSLLRYFSSTGYLAILPYGRATFDDIKVSDYSVQATIYVLDNAEFVGRETVIVRVYNPVLAGGKLHADAGTTLLVYNPANLQGLDYLDVTYARSTVKVYYDVELYVIDRVGRPIENATVKVFDKNGAEVAEVTTDSQGHASVQLLAYEKANDESGNLAVSEDYNPFTVEIYSNGNLINKTKLEIREKKTYYITPDNVYTIIAYTDKTSLQIDEPVTIYTEIKKIDGTPVTGLIVNADIEKPDHTVVTVTLNEIEAGKYQGEFALTDLVGDYNVNIYTQIENVTLETKTKFHVGRIEKLINDVKNELDKHDKKMTAFKFI